MAIEFEVQRLQIGDVILVELPEYDGEVEARVVREIDRTDSTVRVSLPAEGHDSASTGSLSALITTPKPVTSTVRTPMRPG